MWRTLVGSAILQVQVQIPALPAPPHVILAGLSKPLSLRMNPHLENKKLHHSLRVVVKVK